MRLAATSAFLALGAALAASPAAAVVYAKSLSQTVDFNIAYTTESQYNNNPTNQLITVQPFSFQVNQFNPIGSQGQQLTLTGIRITIDRQLAGSITLNNGSANTRDGTLFYTIDSNFTLGLPSGDEVITGTPGGNASIPFSIPRQGQGTYGFGSTDTSAVNNFQPTDFVPYTGTGSFTVTHSLSNFFSDVVLNSGGKGNLTGTSTASIVGSFTIEYLYDDPIPEPASWMMLITGFGLTGGALRRRRAAATAA